MYSVTSGIHIHFAHHVRGHLGPCISLHGHTWLFQVTLTSAELDRQGFVADFDLLYERVLTPCHQLLDHSLAVGEETFADIEPGLKSVGTALVASREALHGHCGQPQEMYPGVLEGAKNHTPGGIKLCVFPFTPTSERLAQWLYQVASASMADGRVQVQKTRIYETLHPMESFADFEPIRAAR
jgi:6-pyruvoyl-tetrahydropterin synthase